MTKIFLNANEANTTFVSEKTGFKKIATDCVCSELLKYVFFVLIRVFSFFYNLPVNALHA